MKPFEAARLVIVLVVICCDVFAAIGGEKPRVEAETADGESDCAMCIMLSRRMIIDGRRRWNCFVYPMSARNFPRLTPRQYSGDRAVITKGEGKEEDALTLLNTFA